MLNSCKVVLLADKCLDKLHEVGYFPSNKYRKCFNKHDHCENDNAAVQQYDWFKRKKSNRAVFTLVHLFGVI